GKRTREMHPCTRNGYGQEKASSTLGTPGRAVKLPPIFFQFFQRGCLPLQATVLCRGASRWPLLRLTGDFCFLMPRSVPWCFPLAATSPSGDFCLLLPRACSRVLPRGCYFARPRLWFVGAAGFCRRPSRC